MPCCSTASSAMAFSSSSSTILAASLVGEESCGISDLQLFRFLSIGAHVLKHALKLVGHFLHPGRSHDFYANRHRLNFNFDFFVVEFSFAQHLAKFLSRIAVSIVGFANRGETG